MAINKQANDVRIVNSETAKLALKHCFNVGLPLFLWGPPGIGKSDLMKQLGVELGRTVIDIRLALWEPTDIKGIPYYSSKDNLMHWAPPGELPSEMDDTSIILFDEMNSAAPAVQSASYQLILDRKVGTYKLPDGVSIVAAGNRESDQGNTYRMPKPLQNRFTHLEMQAEFGPWLEWAIQNKQHADVLGFLNTFKDALFDVKLGDASRAFATPRTWSYVSRLLDEAGLPEPILMDLVAGSIGEGLALKFSASRKLFGKLPNPTEVLSGKVTKLDSSLHDEVSAQYALTTALCYELKESYEKLGAKRITEWHSQADYFFRFLMDNFGKEVTVMGAKVALTSYGLPFIPAKLKHFAEFHKKYGKLVVQAVQETS